MNRQFATYSRSNDCFPSNAPEVFTSQKGCYTYAGKKGFIDWGMALRSVILGHGYTKIDEAVKRVIDEGIAYTRSNKYEDELRELLIDTIPSAEMVKFGCSGSDVTSAAVRLARAYTGRDIVLIAEENPFISQHDWFMSTTPVNDGIPYDNYTIKYNYSEMTVNVDRIEDWLIEYGDLVACIILDPATVDITKEKLQFIRDLCDKYGIVMILDEIISGFRYDLHGVQGMFGVTPDLSTFAKAMGNGFVVSALCGKKDIMQLGDRSIGNVFLLSGTYFNNPIGLVAAIETIKEIENNNVIGHIKKIGTDLIEGIDEAIKRNELTDYISIGGFPQSPVMKFKDIELKTLFDQLMVGQGILMPYISISFSHTLSEVYRTLDSVSNSLEKCKNIIEKGYDIKKYLINGHCENPVFRRILL